MPVTIPVAIPVAMNTSLPATAVAEFTPTSMQSLNKAMAITVAAVVTTFALFSFMAFLISSDQVVIESPISATPITVYQTPEDSEVELKPTVTLQPPTPPPVMPRDNVSPATEPSNPTFSYQGPTFEVSDSGPVVTPMSNIGNRDARPIIRVNPKYPMEASRKGIEGWVQLAFDINTLGEVINVKVIDSTPKRVFDKAAIRALRKWKYRAKSVEGKQVSQHNFSVQLDFTMAKEA